MIMKNSSKMNRIETITIELDELKIGRAFRELHEQVKYKATSFEVRPYKARLVLMEYSPIVPKRDVFHFVFHFNVEFMED